MAGDLRIALTGIFAYRIRGYRKRLLTQTDRKVLAVTGHVTAAHILRGEFIFTNCKLFVCGIDRKDQFLPGGNRLGGGKLFFSLKIAIWFSAGAE